MKPLRLLIPALIAAVLLGSSCQKSSIFHHSLREVDYVNVQTGLFYPGAGSESQPIVQLPNALLRIKPLRESYRSSFLHGFSLFSPLESDRSVALLLPGYSLPLRQNALIPNNYSYDGEEITPYSYSVVLDEEDIAVRYTLNAQSGLYNLSFKGSRGASGGGNTAIRGRRAQAPSVTLVTDTAGRVETTPRGEVLLRTRLSSEVPTTVYLYLLPDVSPRQVSLEAVPVTLSNGIAGFTQGRAVQISFGKEEREVNIRYGISLISMEQARENLRTQMPSNAFTPNEKQARNRWQNLLGRVKVEGATEADRVKFYTALYRAFLWPTDITEGNRYYSPVADSVLPTQQPVYVQDFLPATYESSHPLQLLLRPDLEQRVLASHIELLEQSAGRLHASTPLFTPIPTDTVSELIKVISDSYVKGVFDQDPRNSYRYLREAVLADPASHYDLWCMSKWAGYLGKEGDKRRFMALAQRAAQGVKGLSVFDMEQMLSQANNPSGRTARWFEQRIDSLLYASSIRPNITPDFFAYLFSYSLVGKPQKAQKIVRLIINRYFSSGYLGLPGADRYGVLSSSLAFAMMGIYPVAPGFNAYLIGAPVFSRVRIDMGGGRYFEVKAPGASPSYQYVQAVSLNDTPVEYSWFAHSQIAQGGTLHIVLSHEWAH